MADLNELKLQPFNLADVPAPLAWCIYPEERQRGEVFLPETVYMIVLALRWILTYTDRGLTDEFDTWKVYWKNDDEYGFTTHIYLFREEVEQWDSMDDEWRTVQPRTWCELAELKSEGRGIIRYVETHLAQPYGSRVVMDGTTGVRRLLEDAMLASQATHNFHAIHHADGFTYTYRIDGEQVGDGWHLGFKLKGDYRMLAVDLELWEGIR